jgi:hypothetical protein
MKHLANIDLNKNELQNAVIQNLATAPSTPSKGQIYFNTGSNKLFCYNGTDWIEADGLGATMTGDNIITEINGSASKIDDDNLSTNANTAITNSHSHSAATAKTTPVDADTVAITDSASSHSLAKTTWANIKATLKTYFDTLYNNYVHPTTDGNLHVPATSTTNNGKVLTAGATAGSFSWVTPTDTNTVTRINGTGGTLVSGDVLIQGTGLVSTSQTGQTITIATTANNYSHPNHTGDVTSTGDGATVIGSNKVSNAMLAQVATSTIKGRVTASSGNVEDLTPANVRTIITDTSNRFVSDTQITNWGTAFTNTHTQNSDTGTSNATFAIGASGVKIKNNAGTELQIRNNVDDSYADLRVNNLVVEGTTTTINSNTVAIGDSEIELNSDVTYATNSDGGLVIKRFKSDGTTRADAKLTFNNSTGKWQTTGGDVANTLVTTQIANKVTTTIGNGSLTSIPVTHNLNTKDAVVSIREVSSDNAVMADWTYTDLNTITFKFSVAPASNAIAVTIIG